MKLKCYEYNYKIYCDEDISDKIANYGGDLQDMWEEMKLANSYYGESTFYHADERYYEDYRDLIEEEMESEEIEVEEC